MITVIIPVYNAANKGLEACLCSVARQTYSNLQIVVVDDGSTDESGRICDEWCAKDPRFEVIHQTNQGPAAARNVGLSHARGSEIAFVDCDDLPAECMLQRLHEALELHGEAEMAMSRYNEVSGPRVNHAGCSLSGMEMTLGLYDYVTPLYKNIFAKLYKRNLLCGLYFRNLRTAEDIDFLFQVYDRLKNCAYVDQSLYIYNVYADSIMRSQTDRDYMDILSCYECMVKNLNGTDTLLQGRALDALMRKVVSLRYRNRTLKSASLGNRLDNLQQEHLSAYWHCRNGNLLIKIALIICIKFPLLHAYLMYLKER